MHRLSIDRLELHQARGRATGSIAKRLQEDLCYGRVARRAPMTVGKKMNRIGGQCVVEIDADVRKFAEDRRRKAEPPPADLISGLTPTIGSRLTRKESFPRTILPIGSAS